MNEAEQRIIQLAETYRKPDEFIHEVEKSYSYRVPPNEKGGFFLELGGILYKFRHLDLALNLWNYALKYFIKYGDKQGQSECYANLGNAYQDLKDLRKAIEYYEKYLHIAKKMDDRDGESECYTSLGDAYHRLRDYRKAIECHMKSLYIDKEMDNRDGEAACYGNLGSAYYRLGDFVKAIEYYEQSVQIAKEIQYKAGEFQCYVNLGNVYHDLGDFGKAIWYHEKSLHIAKEIDDSGKESVCYTELGNDYHDLGDLGKTIKYHEKCLHIAKKMDDSDGESKCYVNLGNVYQDLGDFRKAIEYHEKCLHISKEMDDRVGELACYMGLGNAYGNLGDFRKAIELYEQSLQIAEEIENRAKQSKSYVNLGNAYRGLGDFRKAIEYYEKSLVIAKETSDIYLERTASFNLGQIYYGTDPKLAYDYCKQSIKLSEMLSGRLVEEKHKIGFYAYTRASDAYELMVSLCLQLRKGNEALEYTEKSKSRAFLDLIAATKIRPNVELTSEFKSLLGDEEKYLAKLREIQTRHLRPTEVLVEPGEVENIFEHLNLIYDEIEELDPEYVFTRSGKPLSLSKIQDMLSSQKRDVVLIEYFITTDETFIFVVSSKNRELHIETVPLSVEKLNRHAENYWREVVDHPGFKDIGDTWLGLSDYLIEPISEYLTEGDLIYLVPYGSLHYLPMHALELGGEPLIKKHPVIYSPNASLIKFCQNKGRGKLESCASFGVVFKEEAKAVAKLFNTKAYTGYLATKDKVRENCTDKDVIHFSCHGYFNDVDPLSSGVQLYDKEALTAREIFDMRLNSELVTLSACQTGLNERSPGDELIGLTRAFLYAGSPSVIVSLWSVDALSTQELMLEFYTLLKNGLDKATALQEAQKRIMEKEEYSHPYYWAPFVLVGNWE